MSTVNISIHYDYKSPPKWQTEPANQSVLAKPKNRGMPYNKMAQLVKPFVRGIVQVVMLILVVKYFGLQSWQRYKDEKTVVISEKKDLGAIPAPSVTVCAFNPETEMGYTDNAIQHSKYPTSAIVGDICKGLQGEDIVRCIEKKTYNLSTMVRKARKGLPDDNNLAQNNPQDNQL